MVKLIFHTNQGTNEIGWANDILKNRYPTKKAIVVSHHIVSSTNTLITNTGYTLNGVRHKPEFDYTGQFIFDELKNRPNLFLMLSGHVYDGTNGEFKTYREDGHRIDFLCADFQQRNNGGNGWLRIMTFDPPTNQIHVQTYSPTLNQFEYNDVPNDGESDFYIPFAMGGSGNWLYIGESNVVGNSATYIYTPNSIGGKSYEWYVEVYNGSNKLLKASSVTSPIWRFFTPPAPWFQLNLHFLLH